MEISSAALTGSFANSIRMKFSATVTPMSSSCSLHISRILQFLWSFIIMV